MTYTLERAITDYSAEVEFLEEKKQAGIKTVSKRIYIDIEANENEEISIDEAILFWSSKLEELKTGNVNPEDYNY